jgi:hypothetical protein
MKKEFKDMTREELETEARVLQRDIDILKEDLGWMENSLEEIDKLLDEQP